MKRVVLLMAVSACLSGLMARAQDSPTALAERQEAEERYKTLNARLENLEEALQTYQKRMNALTEDLRSVREEMARLANHNAVNAATQKSLESLAEAIREVDRKRLADNDKVLKKLDEIGKSFAERPSSPPRATPGPTAPPRGPTEKGYEYTVQSNDNPQVIAAKLAKQGMKVTSRQIIEANPGVNWSRLRIGQKLFIPAPPE